ncbi:flap endonuclease GEN [Tribolium madens]|uniref:flap endonuclease GEN n=1 Tax=Tribolium madens TaxID=41895 RepID=UPI001CF73D63|nr:flap endonuclease GEN [Tribolium madens]
MISFFIYLNQLNITSLHYQPPKESPQIRKMGIKDLWTILAPFGERKPLYELQGKTVAVDLSCWVCESQNVAEYAVQPRMYLRNLYFRACYLLLMDVNVVFVLEGHAPELKYKTIAARNALQFKGAKPKTEVKTKDRSRFNFTLKRCEEMLNLLGIACVKGEGEAEALCAHLNEAGLIDGIISQDSDCFAYGARVVYRNFSISQQGNQAAKGGSVDVYDISVANERLNFGRNKIIALALLCGSDYCDGVHGIGKDSVMKLFNSVNDDEILPRLRSWRQNPIYEELEAKISDKNRCTSCGHFGKLQAHVKKGCIVCKTNQGCDSGFKNERLEIKNELNMRSKALIDPNFPDENLINEFLSEKSKISKLNLKWRRPDLVNFIKFTVKYLTWEEIYSFEKFFPILTRWQLLHFDEISDKTGGVVSPKFIKKRRTLKGILSYEIVWEDKLNHFSDLIPEEQLEQFGDLEKLWSTVEPQNLVEKAFPYLVREFEVKKPKSRKKKKSAIDEIDDLLQNISITTQSPVKKKTKNNHIHTLDAFLCKASTPKKVAPDVSFDLNQSNFGDEDDLQVSEIVDDIIRRDLPTYVPQNLEKLGLKLNENVDCSFFVSEMIENDLFEKTFKDYFNSDTDSNTVD